MLLPSFIAVVLAWVLEPSSELSGDDLHADELLPPFLRVLTEMFVVRHTAAEGTCELIDDDMDHCPIWYFSIGIQSIDLILGSPIQGQSA